MNTLITGGTGLIGRALITELNRAGHAVAVLTRDPAKRPVLEHNVEVVTWDAATPGPWLDQIARADAIVNLAGESIGGGLWTQARKRRIRRSRERIGTLLVDAITQADAKPAVLVQASAVGYYGPRDSSPLDEMAHAGQDWLSQVAVDWEASTQPVEESGVRRVVIRSGLVLAADALLMTRMMLPFRFFVGGRLGTGRQILSWIHIDDEVRAIRFLMEHPTAAGAFNLTAPNPVSNVAFSRMLGTVMRRPAWLPVPAAAIRLILGEMSLIDNRPRTASARARADTSLVVISRGDLKKRMARLESTDRLLKLLVDTLVRRLRSQ